VVNDRAEASEDKRIDFSEEIAWFGYILKFGDILNMDGPLVEIGSRSVFANSAVGVWQVASGEGSAHDLTPLGPADGGRTVASESLARNPAARHADWARLAD